MASINLRSKLNLYLVIFFAKASIIFGRKLKLKPVHLDRWMEPVGARAKGKKFGFTAPKSA